MLSVTWLAGQVVCVWFVGGWFGDLSVCVFFFNDTATTEIYTLSLHDALPIQFEAEEAKIIIDFLTDPRHNWTLVVVSQSDLWKAKANKTITLSNGKIINTK